MQRISTPSQEFQTGDQKAFATVGELCVHVENIDAVTGVSYRRSKNIGDNDLHMFLRDQEVRALQAEIAAERAVPTMTHWDPRTANCPQDWNIQVQRHCAENNCQ